MTMRFFRALPLIALAMVTLIHGTSGTEARVIEHAMGSTEVPEDPQRIVVLTNEGTEALLAMGIKPVGAVRSWLGDPWYAHIAAKMDGVADLGTEHAPNLELIAALQPDLIIGNRMRQEVIYDRLSAIAPTVFSEILRGDWKENFLLYARAVGQEEQGRAMLQAFQKRTAEIGERLGERRNEEISLVRFMPGSARIYYNDTFAGTILNDIGLRRPASQDKADFAENVTKERIPEMDGDRLIYYVYNPAENAADASNAEREWTSEPLWQRLKAVKAGQVHRVSDAIWNASGGIIAANMVLDDIEYIFGLR